MSELLTQKINEARTLLAEASKEEAAKEELSLKIEQLNAQMADLTAKRLELATSAREKRVIAESQLSAAQTLTGGAEVVNLAEKKAAKKEKAAASAAAAPAKETKGKAGKAKAGKAEPAEKAAPAKAAPVKKTKTAAVKPAEKARVAADDKMPPLHERLRIVAGTDDVTIPEAIERLRARDESWVPESKELKAYISLAFSTHTKDVFQRVKRGVYRVRTGASTEKAPSTESAKADKTKPEKAKAKPVKKAVTAAKTNGAHNPASNGAADEPGNVMENPFSTDAPAKSAA